MDIDSSRDCLKTGIANTTGNLSINPIESDSAKRVLDLIQESPARFLLEPLVTALRQELGIHTKVSKEVEDVALDIRKRLIRLSRVHYLGR